MRHDATATPTSVYRYYDAADVLIYVGITDRATSRNLEHYAKAEWWQYVVRQDVEHLPSRSAALALEKQLILAHRPPFNKQHNAFHVEMRDIYLAFAAGLHGGADEPFLDQYQRLGKRIPLRVVEPRNPETGVVVLATLPFHAPVAQTINPRLAKLPRFMYESTRAGRVCAIEHQGKTTVLQAMVRRDTPAFSSAFATIVITSLKKPIETRLRTVVAGATIA